jgi:hypothetical protein
MPRDNFSKRTITLLAERVGFLCSNPACRIHTVGPNSHQDKSTRIGKAAHITAAAIGGPRYNSKLSVTQRTNINNAIWLCSNCSDLVDKDVTIYSAPMLNKWKEIAELEMLQKIKGQTTDLNNNILNGPYLEADLIRTGGSRSPRGYSNKNPGELENGRYVINISSKPIIHWELLWNLSLVIYNNSSYPAFNISVIPLSEIEILTLSTLPKVNNIQPFNKEILKITYIEKIESTHVEADKLLSIRIPEALNGMTVEIHYFDEARVKHVTLFKIEGQQIVNDKI